MARIIFKIDKHGHVSMEAEGFVGTSCARATEPFAKALGIDDQDDFVTEIKPEFYETRQEMENLGG